MNNELKITGIEPQRRNNKRVSIFINEEFAFGLNLETALKFNLEKGKILDNKFIDDILKQEEQNNANNYAINLLSYRSRSKKEIINKMKSKGYDLLIIENTLKFLDKYELINDNEFAKEFVKYKSKKYGSKRIELELVQKGIKDDIINKVIDEEMNDEAQHQMALEIGRKRVKSYKGEDRGAIYRKLGAYLQRKGFSYEIISKVLKEICYEGNA